MTLARLILRYLPARWISTLMAILVVVVFSRLLEPSEFGIYALVIVTVQLFDSVGLGWIRQTQLRFHQEAVGANRLNHHLSTTYAMYAGVAFVLAVVLAVGAAMLPIGEELRRPMMLAPLIFLVWGFVRQTLEFYRSAQEIKNYSVVECGHTVLSFLLACVLVIWLDMRETGLVLGILLGAAIVLLLDAPRVLRRLSVRLIDRETARQYFAYGIPFIGTVALGFILAWSNRMLIGYLMDSEAVGLYAAGNSIAHQGMLAVFVMVSTASYPLVLKRFEQSGAAVARKQAAENWTLLFGLALPAFVGLSMLAVPIANVMLGADFRETAVRIIPWVALSHGLACMKAFHFDVSFQLAKRTALIFWITIAPAALNVAGAFLLIPEFGIMGAVYSNLAAYVLAISLSVIVGRGVFALPLPVGPTAKIALATTVMAAALLWIDVRPDALGLVIELFAGLLVYGAAVIALDVAGCRVICLKAVARIRA